MNSLIKRHPFFSDFDELWKSVFHEFPTGVKPPVTLDILPHNLASDSAISDSEAVIQLAVAGYEEEDLKVYFDNQVLYIEGDNTHRENIPDKFKSKFTKYFPSKKNLDLEKAQVNLNSGILTITVPVKEPDESRTYLFGKSS